MSESSYTFASVAETVLEKAQEIVANIVKNTFKQPSVNDNATLNLNVSQNETEKFKATPEGLFLAYSSLVFLALVPIVLGSFKSVYHQKKQQVSYRFYLPKDKT
jgi:broad specificity polyphosphatase/5'/3'-nucleotidase SurE